VTGSARPAAEVCVTEMNRSCSSRASRCALLCHFISIEQTLMKKGRKKLIVRQHLSPIQLTVLCMTFTCPPTGAASHTLTGAELRVVINDRYVRSQRLSPTAHAVSLLVVAADRGRRARTDQGRREAPMNADVSAGDGALSFSSLRNTFHQLSPFILPLSRDRLLSFTYRVCDVPASFVLCARFYF
jgi:hypothetical protein